MSVDHYENFPVASWLLPKHLRQPITHIYWFSRSADDIADEGDHSDSWRLQQLAAYREALSQIEQGSLHLPPSDPRYKIFTPLATVIEQYQLPVYLFADLLTAFEQDITVKRYQSYEQIHQYCRHSADPVGRILLHLYQELRPDSLRMSDAICTGLQLTNFWQDVAIDWEKDRVYLPLDALNAHQLDESYIQRRCQQQPTTSQQDLQWQQLMQEQVRYARSLLEQGKPLVQRLPGRIGLELKMIILGGLRILERLDQVQYDVFTARPKLGKADWLRLGGRLLFTRF
ncbi:MULTISPECIES: squalene synthase HpnC [Paenalcaligenes]|uniref:Squalene synthase HpnC n=1 Tax=Paenalcaligenes hermetiae TaxID=1157987 RepID=A0ABP9M2A0_9BURK|nr:squalene synthase HpnC [Paenalcaligenes sp.]